MEMRIMRHHGKYCMCPVYLPLSVFLIPSIPGVLGPSYHQLVIGRARKTIPNILPILHSLKSVVLEVCWV